MPKHKTLQGVVNSLSDSFASPMNRAEGEFVMSEMLATAYTGANTITVDLLTGRASPTEALTPSSRAGVAWYSKQFADMVVRSNSAMEFVREAVLTVTFPSPNGHPSSLTSAEAVCEVRIVDDRGKIYVGVKRSWWDHEGPAPMPRHLRNDGVLAALFTWIKRLFRGVAA